MPDTEPRLPGSDFAGIAEEETEMEKAHTKRIIDAAFAVYEAKVAAAEAEETARKQAEVKALTMLIYGAGGYNPFENIEK